LTLALRLFIFALIATLATPGSAGEFASLKHEIASSRQALVIMITRREMRGPEQQHLVKATADTVSSMLSKMKAPSGKVVEFKELKSTWEAFKLTRETELVPAILANDKEKHDRIGAGIQKVRLDRMYALIDLLEK
jgi:hypothetical protein